VKNVERGSKTWTIEFFFLNSMTDRQLTGRSTDVHRGWRYSAHRSTEWSTDLNSKEETHWIGRLVGRPIFQVSLAKDWSIEWSIGQSTALLEQSTGRSTGSRVRVNLDPTWAVLGGFFSFL